MDANSTETRCVVLTSSYARHLALVIILCEIWWYSPPMSIRAAGHCSRFKFKGSCACNIGYCGAFMQYTKQPTSFPSRLQLISVTSSRFLGTSAPTSKPLRPSDFMMVMTVMMLFHSTPLLESELKFSSDCRLRMMLMMPPVDNCSNNDDCVF